MVWSEAAEAFMRENYPHHSNEWMVDAIEREFGERIKVGTLRMKAHRMGIKLSKERQSKASKEHQIAEVGKVTAWHKGYKFIRTEEGWVNYGKYLIEQATGEAIPKGYAIVFADGDNENYDIDNLVAVPIGWQVAIANNKWAGEMLETGLIWLRLHDLCNGLNRKAIRKGDINNGQFETDTEAD